MRSPPWPREAKWRWQRPVRHRPTSQGASVRHAPHGLASPARSLALGRKCPPPRPQRSAAAGARTQAHSARGRDASAAKACGDTSGSVLVGNLSCIAAKVGHPTRPLHPNRPTLRTHRHPAKPFAYGMRDGSVPTSSNGRTEASGRTVVGAGIGESRPRMQSAATVCAPMERMLHQRRV